LQDSAASDSTSSFAVAFGIDLSGAVDGPGLALEIV
jgi:hypothetical protein